ncbi:MAG: hypothetical protein H8D87_01075 [Deltaproteobacteria bacterium]|nr:hypothetical protein [Candidatus Desulfobacula maris]
MTKETCGYVGCKGQAAYKLTGLWGKKPILFACEKCAPEWAKTGVVKTIAGLPKCYEVERL